MIQVRIEHRMTAQGRDFDLAVSLQSKARHIALFGPSGAGKSLTMQAIAGLYVPDNGHISLDGRVLFDRQKGVNISPARRRVGYVAQNYQLFPHLTVRQNILFGLFHGWRNPSRHQPLPATAEYWIRAFDLEDLLASYPLQISGGQQQRVALARALAAEPAVLILDEPLAALDEALRVRMREELRALQARLDIPTILVTHDREDTMVLAQEVHTISEGKVRSVERQGLVGGQADKHG